MQTVEETIMVDELAFQPTAVCGGRLSTSDYNLRSRKCTEDQLGRLKATPEFKAWEHERGVEAGPSWQARLEQVKERAKALLPPILVSHSKTIAIVSVITLLLVVPMLVPLAFHTTKSSTVTPATTAKEKTPSSSPHRAPGTAPIPTSEKNTEAKLKAPSKEKAVSIEDVPKKQQSKKENEIAAALRLEISKATRAAAAAQEQQQQLALKLEEAAKREALLIEETKRLSAAAAAAAAVKAGSTEKTNSKKSNLQKAFTIGGGDRGQALKPPAQSTGNPFRYTLQYAFYYLATLGPDVGLLTIEAGLLILAAGLMLGLRKSRQAAEKVKKEYLGAYRTQMKMFARAEEAYEAAYATQFAAEKIAIELQEAGNAALNTSEESAAAAEATAAAAQASAKREEELKVKEKQLEKKVDEVKASAAAQSSAWAAAATQLLQLAAASPNKTKNKNQPQQKSRLSKSSSPPSPNTLVSTVTDKYTQLRTRLTTAETAATDAATVADTARQERERSEQRVSEMITDNELLKERLADTKKALAVATDAKAAAELHEAEVRTALETAQQNLATVQAEKEQVIKESESLKESMKTASEKAEAAVKGGTILEAQVDQLTNSLGDESAQKQRAEQRCAQLENDLSALGILADGLKSQVSALEQRLEESMAAQIELKFASKQLEAAHAAAMAAASSPTDQNSPALVQRALNEESAALERLTAAERRAAEASTLTSYALRGGEDVAPRPSLPLPTGERSVSYPSSSPQQINSQRASSLIARAGKIASMLSEGMDGLLAASSPPMNSHGLLALTEGSTHALSARSNANLSPRNVERETGLRPRHPMHSARRRSSIDSFESGSLTARMARASELFNAAEHYLGQDLPSSSSEAAGKRPYKDISTLLHGGDATVNVKKVSGAKENSSADEEVARFIAAGNLMMKESEILQSSLRAQSTNSSGSSAVAERLSAGQVKLTEAIGSAETTTRSVEKNRAQHAALAADARKGQRALEDAQLALTAAMEENSGDAAVAAAAQELKTAETAQQAASEAVYQAERDMYAAVSAQLAARDALKREQEVLQEAFTDAANLLSSGTGGSSDKELAVDALSVSPRVPVGLSTVPTDVFDLP